MPNIKPIVEASVSRVITHFHDTGFALLAAAKWDKTDEANQTNYAGLKADVMESGYGYIPIMGYYTYRDAKDPTGAIITAEEPSLLIPNKARVEGAEPLYDLVRRLGERYDQETVIYAPSIKAGDLQGVLTLIDPRTGQIRETFDWLSFNKVADAWSRLRRGSHAAKDVKFVFESVELKAVFHNPRSFGEALMRQKGGAIMDIEGYMRAGLASGRNRVGRSKVDAAVNSLAKETKP